MTKNRRTLPAQADSEEGDKIADLLANTRNLKKKGSTKERTARSRVTYDLPAALIEQVRQIGEALVADMPGAKVTSSQVAHILLEEGLARYQAGDLTIKLQPSRFVLTVEREGT